MCKKCQDIQNALEAAKELVRRIKADLDSHLASHSEPQPNSEYQTTNPE